MTFTCEVGLTEATQILRKSIIESRAPATIYIYQQKVKELAEFWRTRCPQLVQNQARLLFLAEKFKTGKAKTLPSLVAAHNFYLGSLPPGLKEIQKALLEMASRSASPTQHRTKMSLEDFDILMETTPRSIDFAVRRSGIISLLLFRAALRISEVLHLKVEDLEILADRSRTVFIRKSKTDQSAQGMKVPFRVTTNEASLLSSFLKTFSSKKQFLFNSLTANSIRPLTYSAAAKDLKKSFSEAGLDDRRYTSHSFRGGAASAALSGWDSSSVMMTGRWKSTVAFQAYVRPRPLPVALKAKELSEA
jgi:integrase